MSKYEIIDDNKKRDDYELFIKDLTNDRIYSIFFLKLKDKISKINEFKNHSNNLNYTNDKMITEDTEEVFVNNIPNNLKNEEFYITILSYDGYLIRFFNEEDITNNMCLVAIKNQPFALRHIPNKFINDELIDTAISINGYSIMYVDDKMKTDERCISAYNQCARAIRFMPDYLITYELCVEAVKRDMFCLQYVPDEYFYKVYKEAILDRGLVVPRKGMPGVKITLVGQYRDINNRIDRLCGINNNQNNNTDNIITNDNEEDRYNWLLNRREQLLQELNMVESELYSSEDSIGHKHK